MRKSFCYRPTTLLLSAALATATFTGPAYGRGHSLHPQAQTASINETDSAWLTDFNHADDLFAFAKRATAPAKAGEPHAQYALSLALRACYRRIEPIKLSSLDVESYLDRNRAQLPYAPPNHYRDMRKRIAQCSDFLTTDGLARDTSPPALDQYHYWFTQAVANGDPMARMQRSQLLASNLASADRQTALGIKAQIKADIQTAIRSKDPAAIVRVGALFLMPNVAAHPVLQSASWMLAACELGYDCTAKNPGFTLLRCPQQPTCPTLQEKFHRTLGIYYGKAYTVSREIAGKIRHDNWPELAEYLKMK